MTSLTVQDSQFAPVVYPIKSVVKSMVSRQRNMLDLLPSNAHHLPIAQLGHTRRGVFLINDASLVREIMVERTAEFPKNDLFNAALAPLVGNGVFIADGAEWQHQRTHLEPAVRYLRTSTAKEAISQATGDVLCRLSGTACVQIDLGRLFATITANVVHRLLFGRPLAPDDASDLQDAFSRFQKEVANLRLRTILLHRAFSPLKQSPDAAKSAHYIRDYLRRHIRKTLAQGDGTSTITELIANNAPHLQEQERFSWIVDQVAVFFLAGHETTASSLTWAMIVMSQQPEMRDQWVERDNRFRVAFIKEVMRLYPSGVFLPRVSAGDTDVAGYALKRGAMLLISPWLLHRHPGYWPDAGKFDPTRFQQTGQSVQPGAYLPFGLGSRTCIGGAFAFQEMDVILSEFLERFDIDIERPESIAPLAGLTLGTDRPVIAALEKRATCSPAAKRTPEMS